MRYPASASDRVLIHDLDGDRAPEIIASGTHVDEAVAFTVLPNLGNGHFAGERLAPTGLGEELQAIGDLNGDGIPDLVASDYWSNGIVTYHGRSALQFTDRAPYATATHGGPTLIADLNGDGIADLISFSFGSGNPVRVHLFSGNGDGTFAPRVTLATPFANAVDPSMRIVDGGVEIIAGERSGQLVLYRLAGGTLSMSTHAAGPGLDLTSAFADVNGDGIADIIDADDNSGPYEPIFVTLAGADGTFGERRQILQRRHLTIPFAIVAGDFDGDGRADLIAADFRSPTLYFFRGDGRGNFEEGTPVDAGSPVNSLAAGDLNGDGHLDLVTANADRTISVILNQACIPARRRAVGH